MNRRPVRIALALSLGLASPGCISRTQWLDDATSEYAAWPGEQPWGEFAATLPVSECPHAPTLIVNTTADELDGGDVIAEVGQAGSRLSLHEAMWIAANQGAPHTIRFDEQVFPSTSPGVIALSGDLEFPYPDEGMVDLCIDARHRGVVVKWADIQLSNLRSVWHLGRGSLQIGLTLLDLQTFQQILEAQVAGCRIATDGHDTFSGSQIVAMRVLEGALLGPGNVVGQPVETIEPTSSASEPRIEGNYFGFDLMSRRVVGWYASVWLAGSATLRDNVFITPSWTPLHTRGLREEPGFSAHITVAGNFFGRLPTGEAWPEPVVGVYLDYGGYFTFGPNNVVSGSDVGLGIELPRHVLITRNSIYGNGLAIWYENGGFFSPPTLVSADGVQVTGTCPVAGTIEVFSDSGDEAETYLGTVACDGVAPWTLVASVPSGRYVTATLTVGDDTSALAASMLVP